MTERKNSKGDYLMNIDEESVHWKITPDRAIKNMKKIVIVFIVVAAIIAFVVQINVKEPNDLGNATTLSVEIIFGIFISLIVYVYSKRMHEENKRQQT